MDDCLPCYRIYVSSTDRGPSLEGLQNQSAPPQFPPPQPTSPSSITNQPNNSPPPPPLWIYALGGGLSFARSPRQSRFLSSLDSDRWRSPYSSPSDKPPSLPHLTEVIEVRFSRTALDLLPRLGGIAPFHSYSLRCSSGVKARDQVFGDRVYQRGSDTLTALL